MLGISTVVSAQYQIGLVPRESPDKAVYEKIGYTEINIHYGSPKVKGRALWGNLVSYDKVWRAGANNATTIEFSQDVLIEGKKLPKGKYAFFILPRANKKWIAIFSKKAKQWGTFRYDEKEDTLRVEILPKKGMFLEELKYSISSYGFEYGQIILNWGDVQLELEINTGYVDILKMEIENRVAKADKNIQWVVYLQGAAYLLSNNTRLDLVADWLNKSDALKNEKGEWNKGFYPRAYIEGHLLWTKSLLMAKKGKFEEALKYANTMKTINEKQLFYIRKNEGERIDEQMELWKNKLNK